MNKYFPKSIEEIIEKSLLVYMISLQSKFAIMRTK